MSRIVAAQEHLKQYTDGCCRVGLPFMEMFLVHKHIHEITNFINRTV